MNSFTSHNIGSNINIQATHEFDEIFNGEGINIENGIEIPNSFVIGDFLHYSESNKNSELAGKKEIITNRQKNDDDIHSSDSGAIPVVRKYKPVIKNWSHCNNNTTLIDSQESKSSNVLINWKDHKEIQINFDEIVGKSSESFNYTSLENKCEKIVVNV
jgi:hypothetical protein